MFTIKMSIKKQLRGDIYFYTRPDPNKWKSKYEAQVEWIAL